MLADVAPHLLKQLINHHIIHNGRLDYDRINKLEALVDICVASGEGLPVADLPHMI